MIETFVQHFMFFFGGYGIGAWMFEDPNKVRTLAIALGWATFVTILFGVVL